MLLTFTKTQFKDLIKQGIKKHTIREDKHNRWKAGNSIQFWMGNPRNVHAKNKRHQFGNGVCSIVDTIRMDFSIPEDCQNDRVYIGYEIVIKTKEELNDLRVNDCFENWEQVKLWFDNPNRQFIGRIIFWKACTWL